MRDRLTAFFESAVLVRWRIVKLLPAAGPAALASCLALNLALGLLPIVFMIAMSVLLGQIPAAAGGGAGAAAWHGVVAAFAVAAAAFAVQQVLAPLQVTLAERMARRVDGGMFRRLMTASLRPAGVAPLEDQGLLDELAEASRELRSTFGTPGSACGGLIALVARYVQLAGCAAVAGAVFSWLAAGGLVFITMVFRYGQRGGMRKYARLYRVNVAQRRKGYYFRDIATGSAAAKEIRVFGLAGWLTGRYRAAYLEWLMPVWAERRRIYLWPYLWLTLAGLCALGGVLAAAAAAAAGNGLSLAQLALVVQATLAAVRLGDFYPEADQQTQNGMGAFDALEKFERSLSRAGHIPAPAPAAASAAASSGSASPGPAPSGPAPSGPAPSGPAPSGPASPGPASPGSASPGPASPGPASSGSAPGPTPPEPACGPHPKPATATPPAPPAPPVPSALVPGRRLRPVREIRFDGVTFGYGGGPAVLDRLDLVIPAGRATAVVGLNGAGKTTLVKLLARLYEPTGGRLLADGTDVRGVPPSQWRRELAVIFQDFNRYELSAADNIGFGAVEHQADRARIARAAHQAGILDALEQLPGGLSTPLARHIPGGVDLSGGQWQRVALARALFALDAGASVLVLDEPTASLDVRAEARFFARFLDVTRGVTTVLISHRFSSVRQADHIAVLERGRVSEYGSHKELVAREGRYAQLFALQAERFRDGHAAAGPAVAGAL